MTVLERVRSNEKAADASSAASDLRDLRKELRSALVERLGLTTVAGMLSADSPDRVRAELGVACDAILNSGGFTSLDEAQRRLVREQVLDEVCGLGPIQSLQELSNEPAFTPEDLKRLTPYVSFDN